MEGGGKGRSEDSVQAYAHDAESVEWSNSKILCVPRSEHEIIVVGFYPSSKHFATEIDVC